MRIFIDAGHNFSGEDTGAIGNGLREQDVTFIIAKKLKELFVTNGHIVKMSRENLSDNVGKTLSESLAKRAILSNEFEADLFISIHCNASPNKTAQGTETLIYNLSGKSFDYAGRIQRQIIKRLRTEDRGIKTRPELVVLNSTKCPAVLVETAFISNEEDAKLLTNNSYDFAKAIYEGITQENIIEELTETNDIIWELHNRGIISDKELWLEKLKEDQNSYWLARKCMNYIRGIE